MTSDPSASPVKVTASALGAVALELSPVVLDLNVARKNLGIYPPGHSLNLKGVARAHRSLQHVLTDRPELKLGVVRDRLRVRQGFLDTHNTAFKEFATSLSRLRIGALSLRRGLEGEELARFLQLLASTPEQVAAQGGIEKTVSRADMPHIRLHTIDYRRLRLTEETEISRQAAGSDPPAEANLWHRFVTGLLSSSDLLAKRRVNMASAARIDPAKLARAINTRKLDTGAALQTYRRSLEAFLDQGLAQASYGRETPGKTFENFADLLAALRPELRQQFLAMTFRTLADQTQPAAVEGFLREWPEEMVIEMFRLANERGEEISPTLVRLLQKMGGLSAEQGDEGSAEPASGLETLPEAFSTTEMRKLFEREAFETYVDADYDSLLKDMARKSAQETTAADDGTFPVEEYAHTLTDDHLDPQIARTLLAFIDEDLPEADYRSFADHLGATVPSLLELGCFDLLFEALTTLRRHTTAKVRPAVRRAATETLERFGQPEFIALAVTAFELLKGDEARMASRFIMALGSVVVPKLVEAYAATEHSSGRMGIFDLLAQFDAAAVEAAQERLRSPRAEVVKNLLALMRALNSRPDLERIRATLTHPDPQVRMEALAVLIKFGDPEAVAMLGEALRSRNPETFPHALLIAGQNRVDAVVADLAHLIKRFAWTRSRCRLNEEIIKTLGKIRNPTVIPVLDNLAACGWTLYPSAHARMKIALFESLGQYPRRSVLGLLNRGKRSKDLRIRSACQKLLEEAHDDPQPS